MNSLKFIKISDREFKISGKMNICENVVKSVIVNGETYFNTKMVEVSVDVNDLNKHYLVEHILDFSFINITYKVQDYVGFSYGNLLQKYSKFGLSLNPLVSAYELLFNEKVLDKRIREIYTSNRKEISYYSFKQHFDMNRIPIWLSSYGFNNNLYCNVKMIDFLSIENKKKIYGYEDYKKYFLLTYDINIDENINFKMAEKIILKTIRDKKNKLN